MIGLRGVLLAIAVLLFVIAVFVTDPTNWWSWGLAAFAAAFLVEELGLNMRFGAGAGTGAGANRP